MNRKIKFLARKLIKCSYCFKDSILTKNFLGFTKKIIKLLYNKRIKKKYNQIRKFLNNFRYLFK